MLGPMNVIDRTHRHGVHLAEVGLCKQPLILGYLLGCWIAKVQKDTAKTAVFKRDTHLESDVTPCDNFPFRYRIIQIDFQAEHDT